MAIRDLIPSRRSKQPAVAREEDPFLALRRQMNRLFDDFTGGGEPALPGFGEGAFLPGVELKETDDEIEVRAELPGLDEKDIDVSLSGETLTIRGERREEKEGKDKGRTWSELAYGRFERTVPLPCEVKEDEVDARLRKGVLTVRMPKSAEARERTRKVSVRAE